jgi:alkylation response protein AidB-like acyl-CoA dehydrogenase
VTVVRPNPDSQQVLDRHAIRTFVDQHVTPAAAGFDRTGRIPDEFLHLIGDAGLWAPFLPVESGGRGLSLAALGGVHEEIGRGCSSVRSLLTAHTMVAWAVNRWGTPEQRDRWLRPLAAGTVLGAVCISEPEVGSDATRVGTSAVRRGGSWVLDGTKTWVTGGQCAGLYLVFARTGTGLAAFLVPRDTPRLEVSPIGDMLGTRASMLATVSLGGVTVGTEALLGPEAFLAGMVLTGVLDLGRYSVAAGSIGIVQACLDASAEYAAKRTIGGTKLRDLALVRARITDMVTDAAAGRLLYQRAGKLKDEGDASTIGATMVAKYFAASAAVRHATSAVQVHGANGCSADYPVARLYRDAKVMEIIEGSTEVQRLTIADLAYQREESW